MTLVIDHDEASNRWLAVFPELPGCASAGDTEEGDRECARSARFVV